MPMNEENIQQNITNNDEQVEADPLPTPDLTGELGETADENIVTDDLRDELEIKLEEAVKQSNDFKEALQRERADFSNYKKRVEREKSELRAMAKADAVKSFLPVLDDFDRAMSTIPEDLAESGWAGGFQMIAKKFNDILDQYGIEQIDPVGEQFDHNFHEAIGSVDSDEYESGAVVEVLQKGFVINGKCIRPAIVKVAN